MNQVVSVVGTEAMEMSARKCMLHFLTEKEVESKKAIATRRQNDVGREMTAVLEAGNSLHKVNMYLTLSKTTVSSLVIFNNCPLAEES